MYEYYKYIFFLLFKQCNLTNSVYVCLYVYVCMYTRIYWSVACLARCARSTPRHPKLPRHHHWHLQNLQLFTSSLALVLFTFTSLTYIHHLFGTYTLLYCVGYNGNDEPDALKGRILLFEITTATAGHSSSSSNMYAVIQYSMFNCLYVWRMHACMYYIHTYMQYIFVAFIHSYIHIFIHAYIHT